MFLNLLSLYLHFQILNMIEGKYSVRDVLLILSRIRIYRTEKGEIMSEIPKKAKDLVSDLKIDLDILRKKALVKAFNLDKLITVVGFIEVFSLK